MPRWGAIRMGAGRVMAVTTELRKTIAPQGASDETKHAHVIVFGNEKGGTGKTTTAMHIAVALLCLGNTVSAIDLDSRQRTFARYIENRREFVARTRHELPLPDVQVIERAKPSADTNAEEAARLADALARARETADFVVIDTPGNDTNL